MAVGHAAKSNDPAGDFDGDLKVSNKPPTKEDLERVANLPVLDVNKKKHTFKSLYADNEKGPRRVLIVFIRHFFCGNCQEYLRSISSSITPSTLSDLFPPTEIIIIGCGTPDLITMYTKETDCPFPIYADPTRKLYQLLGMTSTLSLGNKNPEYMSRSIFILSARSFMQELRSGRKMLSGGDFRQVGGEFIFDNGKVTWCHRMKNTRDHAEVAILRKQLGLDGEKPPQRSKRWSTAGLAGVGGLGRRLSNRRQSWAEKRRSWAGPRDKGRNHETEKNNLENGAIEEDKEEDAYAKLTAKSTAPDQKNNSEAPPIDKAVPHTTTNGHPTKPANATTTNGNVEKPISADIATNGAFKEDFEATATAMNGHATKNDGLVNGSANGHVTT